MRGQHVKERTLDPTCPRGFKPAGEDLCYDSAHPALPQFTSAVDCVDKGANLPGLAEAVAVLKELPTGPNHQTWTDDISSNDTGVVLFRAVGGNFSINRVEPVGNSHEYAASLSRGDRYPAAEVVSAL